MIPSMFPAILNSVPPFWAFLGFTNPVVRVSRKPRKQTLVFVYGEPVSATGRIEKKKSFFPSVGDDRNQQQRSWATRRPSRRHKPPRGLSPPRRTTVGGRSGRFRTVHAPCRRSHRPPRPSAARPWRIFQGARGEVLALAAPRCPRARAQSPRVGSARADLAIAARA